MKLVVLTLLAGYASTAGARRLHLQEHAQQEQLLRAAGQQDELAVYAEQWLNTKGEFERALLLNANSGVVDMKYHSHFENDSLITMTFTSKAAQNGRHYMYNCGNDKTATSLWHCEAVRWPWVYSEDSMTFKYKPLKLFQATRPVAVTH